MRSPKLKNISINCVNSEPVLVSKTYIENVKKQMVRTIKDMRKENPSLGKFYFFGVAEFRHDKENDKNILCIMYGDALSALEIDKTDKIYAEVPFKNKLNRSVKKVELKEWEAIKDNLTIKELIYHIKYTDREEEAWEQLLNSNPSNSDLIYIIRCTDKKDEAWSRLLKRNPTNDDLRYIIRHTDKKEEAWVQLLKQNPKRRDLRYIIRHTDKRKEALEQLLKMKPTKSDLRYVKKYFNH